MSDWPKDSSMEAGVFSSWFDTQAWVRASSLARRVCGPLSHAGRRCDGDCASMAVIAFHFFQVGLPRAGASIGVARWEAVRSLRKSRGQVQRPELAESKWSSVNEAWNFELHSPNDRAETARSVFSAVFDLSPTGIEVMHALINDATQVTPEIGLDVMNALCLLVIAKTADRREIPKRLAKLNLLTRCELGALRYVLIRFEEAFRLIEPRNYSRWIHHARQVTDADRLLNLPAISGEMVRSDLDVCELLFQLMSEITPTTPRSEAQRRFDDVLSMLEVAEGPDFEISVDQLLVRIYPSSCPQSFPDPSALDQIRRTQESVALAA
jgi:hypothetical protein